MLFYSYADKVKQDFFIEQIQDTAERRNAQQKLAQVIEYCQLNTCRRRFLLDYFGEAMNASVEDCGGCDVCLAEREDFDATIIAQKILSAVIRTGERFGAGHISMVLRGSKAARVVKFRHDNLSVHGIVNDYADGEIREICGMLLDKGLLYKNSAEYATLGVTDAGREFLKTRSELTLSRRKKNNSEVLSSHKRDEVLEYDRKLFDLLRAVRVGLADDANVPPYIIFGDVTLQQMAYYIPQSRESLLRISGVGATKLEQYGDRFLKAIQRYAQENNLSERSIEPQRQSRQRSGNHHTRIAGSTYEHTKNLLKQGLSIDEVTRRRSLTTNTIVSHIEMLVQQGEPLDLRALLPSADRVIRVQDAFHQVGDNRLTPVKELLGDGYSYEEIRLVRAYMKYLEGE